MKEGAHSQMPFAPVWRADCRVLILGSHPSVLSKQNGFYYMNPHNRFWRVMSALFDADFVGADAFGKRELLLDHGVALYDVVGDCDIVGSQDATIANVTPADIAPLIEGSTIGKVLLNGKAAYHLFCRYFPQYVSMAVCLPSTSPANARCGLDALIDAYRIIKEYL
jgi:hypoxanthine-DNA glycosylase